MRVNAEWLARWKVKARDWNVSTAELMRVLIDQGLEGDLSVLFPPPDDPKGRYVPIHERLREGGRRWGGGGARQTAGTDTSGWWQGVGAPPRAPPTCSPSDSGRVAAPRRFGGALA